MERRHRGRAVVVAWAAIAAAVALVGAQSGSSPARAAGSACSTSGTWRQGEVNVYWFDVEQGDSQLVVGPTGKTFLIDLGETAWNSKGTNTMSARIADRIRQICGIASGSVHLDYVNASHHHLDHIGYAGNPNDTQLLGNGLYRLLTPSGEDFTVGTLLDRDGGTWTDANRDGDCDVGTSSDPAPEIQWHNAGTTSQTARRWICWLYGPASQRDRANVAGHVTTLTNSSTWPTLDLGGGATASVVLANAKGVKMVDGVTPVSGDHTGDPTPPSENDYSVALKIVYGPFEYVTAGDADGEYATSSFGYTYNDVEAHIKDLVGNVEVMRANHHGSAHSSSHAYVTTLAPESAFVSCGSNSYGHPGNRVLDELQAVVNERGVGADVYLANNPCDPYQADDVTPTDYSGTFNSNGDVWLHTTSGGAGYQIDYDAGQRSYATYSEGDGGGGSDGPEDVRVNEYMMAPQSSGSTEWIELYNPTASTIAIGGLYVDDVASGGGSPKQIPAGASIAPGGHYVMEFASGFLNNTGSESVRYLAISGGVETVYDSTSYSLSTTQYDKVFHRIGDGGAWCDTISTNVTKGGANPATCP